MKSVVDLEISVPQRKLAELFADPANNPKWMDELERIEPIDGELGMPGSKYRFVTKKGDMDFVATVVKRELPDEVRLNLDSSSIAVSITDRFVEASPEVTKLISVEEFRFKSKFGKLFGFLSQWAIKKAHRRHMQAFKQFAEEQQQ